MDAILPLTNTKHNQNIMDAILSVTNTKHNQNISLYDLTELS